MRSGGSIRCWLKTRSRSRARSPTSRYSTEGLAKNTGGLDSIVAGLVKMTGGGEPAIPKTIYDLSIPSEFASPKKPLKEQLVMPTPTAILLLDTQRFLLAPNRDLPGFSNAQWADSIPKMLQVKLIQSFENYDVAHAPLRSMDNPGANFQLLVDVRSFQINTDPRTDRRDRIFSEDPEQGGAGRGFASVSATQEARQA